MWVRNCGPFKDVRVGTAVCQATTRCPSTRTRHQVRHLPEFHVPIGTESDIKRHPAIGASPTKKPIEPGETPAQRPVGSTRRLHNFEIGKTRSLTQDPGFWGRGRPDMVASRCEPRGPTPIEPLRTGREPASCRVGLRSRDQWAARTHRRAPTGAGVYVESRQCRTAPEQACQDRPALPA